MEPVIERSYPTPSGVRVHKAAEAVSCGGRKCRWFICVQVALTSDGTHLQSFSCRKWFSTLWRAKEFIGHRLCGRPAEEIIKQLSE